MYICSMSEWLKSACRCLSARATYANYIMHIRIIYIIYDTWYTSAITLYIYIIFFLSVEYVLSLFGVLMKILILILGIS